MAIRSLHVRRWAFKASLGLFSLKLPEQQQQSTAADLGRFWRSLGEMFGQAFCLNKLLKQDRVSIHSSCVSLDWFGGELLREFSADVPTISGVWTVRIWHLSQLDFNLWVFLKGELCENSFWSTVELKAAISEATQRIPFRIVKDSWPFLFSESRNILRKKGYIW